MTYVPRRADRQTDRQTCRQIPERYRAPLQTSKHYLPPPLRSVAGKKRLRSKNYVVEANFYGHCLHMLYV